MSGWRSAALGEIASKDGFAIGPFGSRMKAKDYSDAGFRVVRGSNLTDRGAITGEFVYVSEEFANSLGSARLKVGDITLPHRGAIGRAGLVSDSDMVMSTSLMRVRLDPNLASPRYVVAFLTSRDGIREVLQFASTVGTPGIGQPLTSLKQVRVPLPPLEEQERIAGVLGAFDDLIETNRRLAADLLSILFARYVALGRAQPLTTFGNVSRLVRDQWKPGDVGPDRYLGLEHFATDGAGLVGLGSSSSVQSVSLRFARGDVLYGKLRPYFRKIARPGFDGLCSSEVWVLRAQEGYPQSLVHAVAHSPRFSEVAMAGSGGTRMPRADWKQLSALPVPDLRSSAFSATELDGLEALWSAACELDDESQDLARQRDELLPLLMSGKLRVRDVEEAVS